MRPIFRKDLRAFTVPVLAVIAALYVVKAVILLRYPGVEFPEGSLPSLSAGMLMIVMAWGAGALFAREGERRTIVLLATLPIGRDRIWTAKMTVYYGTLVLTAALLAPLCAPASLVGWPDVQPLPALGVAVGSWLLATSAVAMVGTSLTHGGLFGGFMLIQVLMVAIAMSLAEFQGVAAFSVGLAIVYAGRRAFVLGDPFDAFGRYRTFFGALARALVPALVLQIAYTHVQLRAPRAASIEATAAGAGGLVLEYRAHGPLGCGGSADGVLRSVLAPPGGSPYAQLEGVRAEIVASSPSGARLVLGSRRTVSGLALTSRELFLWEPRGGLVRIPEAWDIGSRGVVWSPDERAILYQVFGTERSLRVFEPGQPVVTIECVDVWHGRYGFAPDGRSVWVMAGNELRAFDRRTGRRLSVRPAPPPWTTDPEVKGSSWLHAIECSPASGALIASSNLHASRFYASRLYRYTIATGAWTRLGTDDLGVWDLGGPGGSRVIGVAHGGDGRRTLVSIDVLTGTSTRRDLEPGGSYNTVALSPDGRHGMLADRKERRERRVRPWAKDPGIHGVLLFDAHTLAPLPGASWRFDPGVTVRWVDDATVAAYSTPDRQEPTCELLHLDGRRTRPALADPRSAAAGAPSVLR